MSVEVNVVGRRCGAGNGGLSCVYCYLPLDARVNEPVPVIDHEAVQRGVQIQGAVKGEGFQLFGGEPLLASLEDLEKLWVFGLEKYGKNGIQTSGRPITEEHIRLFKKYKVSVGFSIDGPEELNDVRWAGSVEDTRRATAHSIAMLKRCQSEGIVGSVIVTLHRKNASAARLPRLLAWFDELDAAKVYAANLHLLEHDGPIRWIALSDEENLTALKAIHAHQSTLSNLRFQVFQEMLALLKGEDRWKWSDGSDAGVGCVWTACDPWTTNGVRGVDAAGEMSLCQRVHKDGIPRLPVKPGPFVRQLALHVTPQEDGGCAGCKFLITCKGQCPGTAIDGDWRKRSRDCRTWYGMFEYLEGCLLATGVTPVTRRQDFQKIQSEMLRHWGQGENVHIADVLGSTASSTNHTKHDDHWDFSGIQGGERVSD